MLQINKTGIFLAERQLRYASIRREPQCRRLNTTASATRDLAMHPPAGQARRSPAGSLKSRIDLGPGRLRALGMPDSQTQTGLPALLLAQLAREPRHTCGAFRASRLRPLGEAGRAEQGFSLSKRDGQMAHCKRCPKWRDVPLTTPLLCGRRGTWLCMHANGSKTILTSDKRGLITRFKLGIPIRDMRLLDPNLLTSETGKILVRDNAIVFSVEHVRLIVTADAVIIPRDGFDHNPLNLRFNDALEDVVVEFARVRLLSFL